MTKANLKKWLKRTFISTAVILGILTSVLAVHIYQVSNKPKGGVDGWQMARIDFTQPIDSSQSILIRTALHQLEGIHHSVINIPEGILVYAYDPMVQNSRDIFVALGDATGLASKRFVVAESDLSGACPIIDKNSITYRVSSGFQKLFKGNAKGL
jgi:hypothetical protein